MRSKSGQASLLPAAAGKDGHSTILSPVKYEYIPREYLPNLYKHCYNSVDNSLLSRFVLRRYWDFVIRFTPTTIAPNAITLIGFVVGMSSSFVLAYYYFFENAVFPVWTWWYAAASLFFYQTCDAIDGKQARRTGTCSALGELFDHGCDALLTPFVQISQALALGSGSSLLYVYIIQSSVAFFMAIWEQYTTGVLVFGFISAPTEGIIIACVNFIISGIFTSRIWDTSIIGPYTVRLPQRLTTHFTDRTVELPIASLRSVTFIFFELMWMWTVGSNLRNGLTRSPVLRSRVNSICMFFCVGALTVMHACMYLFYADVHDSYPFVFELSYSILIAYIVSSITITRLCKMSYDVLSNYYLLTAGVVATALIAHWYDPTHKKGFSATEHRTLGYQIIALVILGCVLTAHKMILVFRQMAQALNIKIMSISKSKNE